RVEGGKLDVSGVLSRSDVTIGAAGTLGGGGRVAGDVANSGVLALDAGDGFTIEGDYSQGAGAVLAVTLGHGHLDVGGDASIDGGVVRVTGVRDGYVHRDREQILAVEGELDGLFHPVVDFDDEVLFFQGSLAYDLANNVWLEIDRLDVHATVASLGRITAASLSSAERVENAFRRIDGQREVGEGPIADGVIRAAGEFQRIGSANLARASLASLSGELHAMASSTTFDAVDMNRRALSSQFVGTAALDVRPQAWKQQLGGGGYGGFSGSDQAIDGWMIGRDMRLGNAIAGFAFGETRADSRRDGSRDRGRDRQAQSLLYAGLSNGSAYLLGQAGFGRFDRQLERHLFTGQRSMGVFSSYAGDFMTASLESGYRFGSAGAGITPYVGAEYTRIESDGFNELGGDGLGLRADAWTSSRSQAIAGLRLERSWLSGVNLHGY